MTWDSRMGARRLEDGKRSFVCLVRGHDTEVVETACCEVPEPEDDPVPEPEPGVAFLEQPILMHWISEIELEIFQCKRCGAVWRREVSTKMGPPKRMSHWGVMRVNGRVIPPLEET